MAKYSNGYVNLKQTAAFIRRSFIAAAILWSLLAGSARTELVVQTEIGLGNSFKAGGWTPVRLNLKNQVGALGRGDANFDGFVRLTTVDSNGQGYTFSAPLELPLNGRKLIELPIVLPDPPNAVTVELIPKRGRRAYVETLQPNAFNLNLDNQRQGAMITPTVLLLTPATDSPSFNSTALDAANTRVIQASSMPRNYKSYDGVNLLVVRQALSSALELDQIEALDQWLRLGGHLLVIVPKAAAEIRQDRWLGPRLPAPLVEAREVNQKDLEPTADPEKILIAAWGTPAADARVLWNSPAGPLALQRPHGMGTITALGIDQTMVGSAPLRIAVASFYEALVLAPSIEDVRARHYWETSNVMPFSDTLTLPNRMIVILIIAAFVVIVGPMNFSFLRRRRRLELAWVTIPALSILFFSTIYAYGVASKGGHQQFGTAEIVHLTAGQPDGLMLWNAMQFSPRRDTYSLSAGPMSSMIPLLKCYDNPIEDLGYSMGQQFMNLTGIDRGAGSGRGSDSIQSIYGGYELAQQAGQWEPVYYVGEKPLKTKGTIDGDVTLLRDGSFRVRIVNGAEAVLRNAVVRVGAQRVNLGQIDPGQKIERSMQPTVVTIQEQTGDESESNQYPPGYRGRNRPLRPRPSNEAASSLPNWADNIANKQENVYPNLELVHPQRRCRLIARQDLWPSEVKVLPEPDMRTSLGLVEVDLPLRIEGQVVASSKDVLRREVYHCDIKSNSGGSHSFGENGNFCELESALVDILFAPPRLAGPVRVAGGTIDVVYEAPGQAAGIQVFNYQLNRWEPMLKDSDPVTGRRSPQARIKAAWVNPWTPMVRVRLEAIENKRGSSQNGVVFKNISVQMDLEPVK